MPDDAPADAKKHPVPPPDRGLIQLYYTQTKRNHLDTLLPWNWKQRDDVAPVNSG